MRKEAQTTSLTHVTCPGHLPCYVMEGVPHVNPRVTLRP